MTPRSFATICFLTAFLGGDAGAAECTSPDSCVPDEDMQVFLTALSLDLCRKDTVTMGNEALVEKLKLKLEPVTILTDKDGRVFLGGGKVPLKLSMNWCGYKVEATGEIKVLAALKPGPTWGFHFRLKLGVGLLPYTIFTAGDWRTGIEAGILVDFFYVKWFNLNVLVGWRSAGFGVGFDVTRNLSLVVGYGITWGDWVHNPYLGVAVALW